jgi:NAD(P)-dependent dehydrogenase (short-subunit alcohol dehydrogenase family)
MEGGEVAVVVGAGPGLGAAVAHRFAKGGYRVAVMARSKEKLETLKEEIIAAGGQAIAVEVDAANEDSIKEAFATVVKELGHPSVLVYNAALLQMQENATSISPSYLVESFRVNVVGALASVQQVVGHMKTQRKGTILLTGGGLSRSVMTPKFTALAIGKSGIRSLGQGLFLELKEHNIRATSVTICGFIKPEDPIFSPTNLAEVYWTLHTQNPSTWKDEEVVARQ